MAIAPPLLSMSRTFLMSSRKNFKKRSGDHVRPMDAGSLTRRPPRRHLAKPSDRRLLRTPEGADVGRGLFEAQPVQRHRDSLCPARNRTARALDPQSRGLWRSARVSGRRDTHYVERLPHESIAWIGPYQTPVRNTFLMFYLIALIPEIDNEILWFCDDFILIGDLTTESVRIARHVEDLKLLKTRGRG